MTRGDFRDEARLYLWQSPDPWVNKLQLPARVTNEEVTLTAPTAVSGPQNTVTIVSKEMGLSDESITVTADVATAY